MKYNNKEKLTEEMDVRELFDDELDSVTGGMRTVYRGECNMSPESQNTLLSFHNVPSGADQVENYALLTPGLGTPAIPEESINGISDIDAADLAIRQTTFSNKDILSLSPSSGSISKTLSDQL